ncbi:hypothetical protein ACJJIQ_01510 [Microbulbifer sp. ANSA003]|uniref:hypothetical protein n=1 Tax=Microbulbifer sp. ANSA003 TaxID=3243360 RepID=UPI0040435D60
MEKDISGCKFTFTAPPYSDPFSDNQEWETEPTYFDILNDEGYQPITYKSFRDLDEEIEFPHVQFLNTYSSRWAFKGMPILQSYGGFIGLCVGVEFVGDLPINETLFNNNTFLKEVYRTYELTKLQSFNSGLVSDPFDLTQYRWPSYLGPLNSQWVEHGGVDWLYFETQPLVNGSDTLCWQTAISDKHILSFNFSIRRSGLNAGNAFRMNQRTSLDNYICFIKRIMDSLVLELPPELSARRMEIHSVPSAASKSLFGCSTQQIEDAKYVMQMWSGRGYRDAKRDKNESHRATFEEVSTFIDKRIQPRPLENSYSLGEKIEIISRVPSNITNKPLIGPKIT